MNKALGVVVGEFSLKGLESDFKKDAYGSAMKYIKNNVVFQEYEENIKKLLLSFFAVIVFGSKGFEPEEEFLIFDGVQVPFQYIYDFILNSPNSLIKELLTEKSGMACPEAFVRKMSLLYKDKL